ncbi:MAG: hypothetical protein HYT08_04490 [Candidatus Levybacteria bacterium]|nr:hypothetical protein [Candidatus Levybacteria bacterium]
MITTETSRKISRRDLLSMVIKSVTLLGLAKISVACGKDNTPSGATQETPSASSQIPSESPTAKATEAPTLEPTQASTRTEIQPTPPCQILEDKYCSSARLTEWKNSVGQIFKVVSLDLPEGVSIITPFDGTFTYSDGPGNLVDPNAPAAVVYKPVSESDQSNLTFMVTGDIEFDRSQIEIKKGDVIARTGNTGLKVLDGTIAIVITSLDPEKKTFGTDEALLENLFPNLVK